MRSAEESCDGTAVQERDVLLFLLMLGHNLNWWVLPSSFFFIKHFTAGLGLLTSDFSQLSLLLTVCSKHAFLLSSSILASCHSRLCAELPVWKRESLWGWRNCQHAGVCTLQSYSLFVWLSCIGTFTVEQDSVVPGIKYWKKRKGDLPPLRAWECERDLMHFYRHMFKKKRVEMTHSEKG